MNSRMTTRAVVVLLLTMLCLAASGCGRPANRVSGTVFFGGKPLSGGSIVLLASDGLPYRGLIGPDGKFALTNVPPGLARVAVTSLVEPAPSGGHSKNTQNARGASLAPSASRIPMRYGDLAQSGLSVTVEGETPLDLNLR
jgi:hypothetical protein